MSDLNILIVEDDPDGSEVVQRMLRHHHIANEAARSGEDALLKLAGGGFSGAILDLALPGIDGWNLLRKIKADPRTQNLPCVATTAFHSADIAVKAVEAGFVAYFPKPLEAGSFVQELQRALAQS
jgi:CheY-like chemotaxis protein